MRWLLRWSIRLLVLGFLGLAVFVGREFIGLKPIEGGELLCDVGRVLQDGYVSSAVIETGNGVVLIDAGNDPKATAIRADLKKHDKQLSDVIAIFLTHGHADHIAGLPWFEDAVVYALAPELPYLRGETAYHGPVPRLFGRNNAGLLNLEGLEDGAEIRIGRLRFRAIALPGHTAGSAAWLVNGCLFVGDSASARADGSLAPAPWIFTDDPQQNLASLRALPEKLGQQPVRKIVFSHTGSVETSGAVADLQVR